MQTMHHLSMVYSVWLRSWVGRRWQVAKQMVMTLGMSPEIGQRLLGGQQQGGPFMGRGVAFRWTGAVAEVISWARARLRSPRR